MIDLKNVLDITINNKIVKQIETTDNIIIYKKSRIPFEYQEVEYIESTGTQYIDTEYVFVNPELKIEAKYRKTSNLATNIYGIDTRKNPRQEHGQPWNAGVYLGNGVVINNISQKLNTDYVFSFEFKNNIAKWHFNDDIYTYNGNNGWNGATITTTLFGSRRNNTIVDYLLIGRIYYMRFYDNNDVLVRNFIPCYKKSDGEIGMYDTISKRFFTNAGTGNFNKGNNVT